MFCYYDSIHVTKIYIHVKMIAVMLTEIMSCYKSMYFPDATPAGPAAPPCPKSAGAREVCEGREPEAAAKRQKVWTEASICTSSLWIEFAFGFCTMTLVHF